MRLQPDAVRYLRSSSENIWTKDGFSIAARLAALGLISGSLGVGFQLSSVVHEQLKKRLGVYSVLLAPHDDDLGSWSDVLLTDPPRSDRRNKIIIHQFSDLFFDGKTSQSLNTYLARLKKLREKARTRGEEDGRPDIIVICGNLVAVPCDGRSGGGICQDAYRKALKEAADNLRKAVEYMRQSVDPESSATHDPCPILVIPGTFDLDWSHYGDSDGGLHRYSTVWRDAMRDFHQAGSPWICESLGVRILPFDTTSLEGAFDHGREQAVADLARVRERLQRRFIEDWEVAHDLKENDVGFDARMRILTRDTLGYVVDVSDQPEAFDDVKDPTFKWKGVLLEEGMERQQPKSYLSDAGFISRSSRAWLAQPVPDQSLSDKPARKPWVSIAATHHHPQDRRRSCVIEFFNGHDFRQQLARSGIKFVLHGHSDRQHVLSEMVYFKPSREAKTRSDTIELIGSGRFCDFGAWISEPISTNKPYFKENPSYNEIHIVKKDTEVGPRAEIKVIFCEITGSGVDGIVERGAFAATSDAND
jgi:hypothetical protein